MLTNKEKRKAIEKALGPLIGEPYTWGGFFDALAEEAIVIPMEIEHRNPLNFHPYTMVRSERGQTLKNSPGHLGKPGKAIAIIIPGEE